MSSQPTVSYVTEAEGFWDAKIKEYYRRKRHLEDIFLKIIRDNDLQDIPSANILSIDECKKLNLWKQVLCDFGESCATWHLEIKEQVLLACVRWIEFPLQTLTGLDIVGLKTKNDEICCAESKAKDNTDISSALTELQHDLSPDRLEPALQSPLIRYGSKAWLLHTLVTMNYLTKEKAMEIYRKPSYTRYGFVFHPRRQTPQNYGTLQSRLSDGRGPVNLYDYDIEDFEAEIIAFLRTMSLTKVPKC